MIDIYNVKLLDIIPPNLKHDPDIIAASKAIDNEFSMVVTKAKECIILPRIDELDSDIIDILAWEMHIDFYDPTLPLDTRRQLVKNSLRWHQMKGTPSAVEELISTLFDEGRVEEWFEYGGEPYTFRVVTNNSSVTQDRAMEFIKALNSVKNARSWLDRVIITQMEDMQLYFAGIVHTGDNLTIRQVV